MRAVQSSRWETAITKALAAGPMHTPRSKTSARIVRPMRHSEAPRSLPLRPGDGETCRQLVQTRYRLQDEVLDETVRYFDSFDWRLYERGTTIVTTLGDAPTSIIWQSLDGATLRRLPSAELPVFVHELPPGPARDELESILGARRLLPLVEVRRRGSDMRLLDGNGKTVLRLRQLERGVDGESNLGELLRIEPLKGYERHAHEIEELLARELGERPAPERELDRALAAVGRTPLDYTSRVSIDLQPDMPAEAALRRVHASLLATMRANENGVSEDLDPEFLHDFRVAVRRTRSALSQIKGVYPTAARRRFRHAFAWLGSVTGPQRDLDVYLLQLRDDRETLAAGEREDLDPVVELLHRRRAREHHALERALAGTRYRTLLEAWEDHLGAPVSKHPSRPHAHHPILEVASRQTWKVYRRVLTKGEAIDASSPDRDLHRLRIEAKKLRYLMELFRSLYPEQIGAQIKALKRLQDLLGDLNDDSVQEAMLREIAEELGRSVSFRTHLVLGRLVERRRREREALRAGFTAAFSSFAAIDNRTACRELFRRRRGKTR